MTRRTWEPFGEIPPMKLADARLQLHHAAQVALGPALTYVEKEPDDSHTNMAYEDGALVGQAFGRDDKLTARLHLGTGMIELRDDGPDNLSHWYPLDGKTKDEATMWLAAAIESVTDGDLVRTLGRPEYILPHHPLADGAPFTADKKALVELEKWFANADLALNDVARAVPKGAQASAVRTWPHHFDIGTLISLAPDEDPETAPSIGLGLSPGDETYGDPYFYTRAYPFSGKSALPPIDAPGFWHTDGWYGMILRAGDLVRESDAEQTTRRHLEQTVRIARSLLEVSP